MLIIAILKSLIIAISGSFLPHSVNQFVDSGLFFLLFVCLVIFYVKHCKTIDTEVYSSGACKWTLVLVWEVGSMQPGVELSLGFVVALLPSVQHQLQIPSFQTQYCFCVRCRLVYWRVILNVPPSPSALGLCHVPCASEFLSMLLLPSIHNLILLVFSTCCLGVGIEDRGNSLLSWSILHLRQALCPCMRDRGPGVRAMVLGQ